MVPKQPEPKSEVLNAATQCADSDRKETNPRIGWAQLLARVFGIDVTKCHDCGGKIKVISAIIDSDAIKRILDHLGLPAHVPKFAPP